MYKNKPCKKQQNVFQRSIKLSSLQKHLMLFVIIPLILLAALGLRLVLQQANDFQQKRLKNDLELIGRAISIPVGTALTQADVNAVINALDSVFFISEVYGASVFDIDGKLIASAGVTETDLQRSKIPAQIQQTGKGHEQFSRVQGRRLFSHFLPLFDEHGHIQGLVQISRKASDFEYSLKRLTLLAWLLWAVFSLLIVIAVLMGHYGAIGRYVDKLLNNIKRVAEGDFSHRLALQGPKELVLLTQGLNSMLDNIVFAHQQLERQQAEQNLLIGQLKEQEKEAEIGRMAQGVAHELGAPLSVIDGRARRLQKSVIKNSDNMRQLDIILQQVQRLTAIVHQLLDYSRSDLRQQSKVDIENLLNKLLEDMQAEFEQASCDIAVECQPESSLYGDQKRLYLALANIIRNALQAGSEQVVITVKQQQQKLIIQVSDDGQGLPEQPAEQLVQAFFTTKLPGQGTGLGLAIVQAVVDEFNGELVLENSPSGGCQVSLYFNLEETFVE